LLGPDPLYEKEFEDIFRLSRTRVQRIIEDVSRSGDPPFYRTFRVDMFGRMGPSREAKILLPLLRCLAYRDPLHCFSSCFQMSVAMAKECYCRFLHAIHFLYIDEYLRLPIDLRIRLEPDCSTSER
jgi:hypothetical protein